MALMLAVAALLPACADDPVQPEAGGPAEPAEPAPRAIGLVEIAVTGLGTGGDATTYALSAPTLEALEALRGRVDGAPGGPGALQPQLFLPVQNQDGSGDGTIQLEPYSTGTFTWGERGAGGVRYVWATYRVRNAQADGTPYDWAAAVTFVAVNTAGSIEQTAISTLRRFDGSAASAGVAPGILPTGAVRLDAAAGTVESAAPDILQVFTELEAAEILDMAPAGVTSALPYGFVVQSRISSGNRTLPADPAADEFDGTVTFAFKVPLQADAAKDPFSIHAMFLAVLDLDRRITQSLEEQTSAGQAAFETRVASLFGGFLDHTNLLPGGSYGGSATSPDVRTICSVRTAGTAANPTAFLVDDCASFDLPDITGFTPNQGPVGTSVGISGQHLEGFLGMEFNGVPATVLFPEGVGGQVPEGATSGPITVITTIGARKSEDHFFVDGIGYNGAVSLDGTGDYVSVPDEADFDFTSAFTVEAWFRVDAFDKDWQAVVTKGDNAWRIHRDQGNDGLDFGTNSFGVPHTLAGATAVNDGAWHHVAAVFDNGEKRLYVDGVLDAAASDAPETVATNDHPVYIGENAQNTGRTFQGAIDEVRVWNVALTAGQIRSRMHTRLDGDEAGLVGYWGFDDAAATDDQSVVGNDVTLAGNAAWTTSDAPIDAGEGVTVTVDAGGTAVFGTTGLAVEFSGVSGSGIYAASRIDVPPAGTRPRDDVPALTAQTGRYWTLALVEENAFAATPAEHRFALGAGAVSAADAANPAALKLYCRPPGSTGSWTLAASAASANAATGEVVFTGAAVCGQYVVATEGSSLLNP